MTDTAETIKADICIIGAGSGGLSVAAGAVQMGAKVVLVEKHLMGGDCLNTGCVPSKALLEAGKAAKSMAQAADLGISAGSINVDFTKVMAHVHQTIANIAPHDSVERFEGLGVRVLQGAGQFVDPRTLQVGGQKVIARRFVIATGATAAVPPIPGLKDVPYLTNETLFNPTEPPDHLLILGGGPIGCEMAQAFACLGVKVTLVEAAAILGNAEPAQRDVLRHGLADAGVTLMEGVKAKAASTTDGGIKLQLQLDGTDEEIVVEGSHLLVATGRRAQVSRLNLEAAGVTYSPRGVQVDETLRSSNRHIFAIGDVAHGPWGPLQFTHVAGYHASVVIKRALFRLPARADHSAVPKVTYTEPEIASVGLTEAEARAKYGESIRVMESQLADNDRAVAANRTRGSLKVVTTTRGKVLGAHMAAPHAGDLLQPWVMAVSRGDKVGPMASHIAAYPTLSELNKRAAGAFYTQKLFSPGVKRIVRLLAKLG